MNPIKGTPVDPKPFDCAPAKVYNEYDGMYVSYIAHHPYTKGCYLYYHWCDDDNNTRYSRFILAAVTSEQIARFEQNQLDFRQLLTGNDEAIIIDFDYSNDSNRHRAWIIAIGDCPLSYFPDAGVFLSICKT